MTVKKEPTHPISDIFNADGTPNVLKISAGLAHAFGQHAAGHIVIGKGAAKETKQADGSVDVDIHFNRK